METPPVTEPAPPEADYRVRLDIFEGPMDLLLHLIKVNEMDIYDISISRITQQYFSYLRLMEQLDLEVAGDFLVMASTLINIKLRSLLPETSEEIEEDEEVDDYMSAQALMDKLVEYRKFKEAAENLRSHQAAQSNMFVRDVALPKMSDAETDNDLQMDLDMLLGAFSRVLRFVERREWHLITEEEYSVEEKMDWLEQRLLLEERLQVEDLFKACRSRLEMIVVLLAALELCHLRRVCVAQSGAFGSIMIFPQTEGPQPVEEEAEFEPWPEPPPAEADVSPADAEGLELADSWDGEEEEEEEEEEDEALDEEEFSAEIVQIGDELADETSGPESPETPGPEDAGDGEDDDLDV